MFVLLPAVEKFAALVESPALGSATNGAAEQTAAAKQLVSVGEIVPAELVTWPRLVVARA